MEIAMSRNIERITEDEIKNANKYLTDKIDQMSKVLSEMQGGGGTLRSQKAVTLFMFIFNLSILIMLLIFNERILNDLQKYNFIEPFIPWLVYGSFFLYASLRLWNNIKRYILLDSLVNDEIMITQSIRDYMYQKNNINNTVSSISVIGTKGQVISKNLKPIDTTYLERVKGKAHFLSDSGDLKKFQEYVQIFGVCIFALYVTFLANRGGLYPIFAATGLPFEFSSIYLFSEYMGFPHFINFTAFLLITVFMLWTFFRFLKRKINVSLNYFTYALGLTITPISYVLMIALMHLLAVVLGLVAAIFALGLVIALLAALMES
jgi:hypothetical protein